MTSAPTRRGTKQPAKRKRSSVFATDKAQAQKAFDALRWGKVFKKLLEVRGVKRGRRGDRKSTSNLGVDTVEKLAAELGVPIDTAKKRLAQADAY